MKRAVGQANPTNQFVQFFLHNITVYTLVHLYVVSSRCMVYEFIAHSEQIYYWGSLLISVRVMLVRRKVVSPEVTENNIDLFPCLSKKWDFREKAAHCNCTIGS